MFFFFLSGYEYCFFFQLLTQEDLKVRVTFINDFEQMSDCFFTNIYSDIQTL